MKPESRGRNIAARGAGLQRWMPVLVLVCLAAGGLEESAAVTATASQKSSLHVPGAPDSARNFYAINLGIDRMSVRLVESGELVRFSYRVTDVAKATPLHDRASSPQLMDAKTHAVLQVPTMEKVGPLRQSTTPEYGKSYWMVFSNKGNIVKAGHRVSVVIGQFQVDGLVVQ